MHLVKSSQSLIKQFIVNPPLTLSPLCCVNSTWFPTKRHNSSSQESDYIIRSRYPDVTIPDMNYGDFLLQNAHKYLNNVAVIDGVSGETVTYSQLLESRKSISSGLKKLGLQEDDRVCICMRNSTQYVMAFLGSLSANLVVSPINPACTKEELLRQITISGSQALIIDQECVNMGIITQETASLLKKIIIVKPTETTLSSPHVNFDTLLNDNGSAYTENRSVAKTGTWQWMNKLVLLPYSSGTTGLPKGVMLSHGNLISNLLQHEVSSMHSWKSKDVILGLLPMYHLYCLGGMLPRTLHSGAKLLSLPKFDPNTFIESLCEHKVTACYLVPPLIYFLNNSPKTRRLDLSSLTDVFSAAAPLDANQEKLLRDLLRKHNSTVDVSQGYGLSETSPLITFMPKPILRKPGKEGSVGVVISSQEVKIICPEKLTICKPMETGELWVRGPNIMLGYLDNQKATEECLLPDGWLRTGDIGYYDDDHYFYIVDRLKEFIKYNAFQVAPAELEGILLSHPDIIDCAVVGKPHSESGELPTAFVVLRDKESVSTSKADEICAFVKERVSSYKQLRGGVIFVDAIPKSPSGKILRRNLRVTL